VSDPENPLYETFRVLCQTLCTLWGVFSIIAHDLQQWRERWHQQHTGRAVSKIDLVAGYSLAISDITGEHDNGWRINFPAGGYAILGHTFDDDLDDILSRNGCWAVSQGYERFETFLFDVTAAYLHSHPAQADKGLKDGFENKGKNEGASDTSLVYWQRLVRHGYRSSDNAKILGFLRELAPALSEAETSNDRNVDLTEWYAAVSEVRHAATHADCVVKEARLAGWPDDRQRHMASWFPYERDVGAKGMRLRLRKEHAEKALERFAEYGYQVLKRLSAACGYPCQLDGLRPTAGS